jgi:hypothetical protein
MSQATQPSFLCDVGQLGQWQASCGPEEETSRGFTYVVSLGALLVGVGCVLVPKYMNGATPEDTAKANIFFVVAGIALIVLAVFIFLGPFVLARFSRREVHLFDNGLVIKSGANETQIPWTSIALVKQFEWYDNRFSPRSINVVVITKDQKKHNFSSTLKGDADRIIERLEEKAPHTEFIPFTA